MLVTFYCNVCPHEFTDTLAEVGERFCPCCDRLCQPGTVEPEEDEMQLHPSITEARVMAAVEAQQHSLEDMGFCIHCGADAEGVEPDARKYVCEACGFPGVYGAEELLFEFS